MSGLGVSPLVDIITKDQLAMEWGERPTAIIAASAVTAINALVTLSACSSVCGTTHWRSAVDMEALGYLSGGRLRSWADPL